MKAIADFSVLSMLLWLPLLLIPACSEDRALPDLTGFQLEVLPTEGATGPTFKINLPEELPKNVLLVLINENRQRTVLQLARQDGRFVGITFSPPPGGKLPAEPTHAMLIASASPRPTKDELEQLVPDPLLGSDAGPGEILRELQRLGQELQGRIDDCAVRIEGFQRQ